MIKKLIKRNTNIDLMEHVTFSTVFIVPFFTCLLKTGLSCGLAVESVVQSSVYPHLQMHPGQYSCISTGPRDQSDHIEAKGKDPLIPGGKQLGFTLSRK